MKRILLPALGVMMIASLSYGQGFIGVSIDDMGVECQLTDAAPGLCTLYLVMKEVQGISAELSIDNSHAPGIGLPIGTTWNQPVAIVPDGETVFSAGVSLGFGACKAPPILLGTFSYFCSGLSMPCEYQEVVPFVGQPYVVIADCTLPSPNILIAQGGVLTINDTGSCDPLALCGGYPEPAVEATSWGQIKALYE